MKRHGIERRDLEGEDHPLHGTNRSPEVTSKISDSLEGRTFSAEACERMSESHVGNPIPEAVRQKISESLTGIERSEQTRQRMSESTAGASNPNWKGGYSRRYGPGWATARTRVQNRDEVCQQCGHDGRDRRLEVHHIIPVRVFRDDPERDLQDAHDLDNLVLLCRRCHGKVEHGAIEASFAESETR
ncbi:HNH endonuclease [Halapricum salinum]|nr:HNH endonuclease signature motif containing protein [Halapricum salinum]